jgi:hypothetical protein
VIRTDGEKRARIDVHEREPHPRDRLLRRENAAVGGKGLRRPVDRRVPNESGRNGRSQGRLRLHRRYVEGSLERNRPDRFDEDPGNGFPRRDDEAGRIHGQDRLAGIRDGSAAGNREEDASGRARDARFLEIDLFRQEAGPRVSGEKENGKADPCESCCHHGGTAPFFFLETFGVIIAHFFPCL